MSVPVPPSPCPWCRRVLWDDDPKHGQPVAGDFVVCAFCWRPSILDDRLHLRLMSPPELERFQADISRLRAGAVS